MHSNIKDFKTGWFGITFGLTNDEIDNLISKLENLKQSKDHFHFRIDFEGEGGIGDVEIYWDEEKGTSLDIE